MGKIKERRAVLIARFSQLGDVAMALPSVYDACYANPGVSFYFLTHHHAAGIFCKSACKTHGVVCKF